MKRAHNYKVIMCMCHSFMGQGKTEMIYFYSRLTALPDDGSIKSAKYPAAVSLEQISLALSMNCKRREKNIG